MKRLAIIAAVLLALVVTASAIIEAYEEATSRGASDNSPSAPQQTPMLPGTPLSLGRTEYSGASSGSGANDSGVPTPVEARTAVLGAMVAAQRLRGVASWMPAKYGPDYLAMRLPRGTAVTICAATCIDMTVNDYGPSKRIHPDRIADIAVGRWEAISGLDRSAGVASVTVTVGLAVAARPTLPPTDGAP